MLSVQVTRSARQRQSSSKNTCFVKTARRGTSSQEKEMQGVHMVLPQTQRCVWNLRSRTFHCQVLTPSLPYPGREEYTNPSLRHHSPPYSASGPVSESFRANFRTKKTRSSPQRSLHDPNWITPI